MGKTSENQYLICRIESEESKKEMIIAILSELMPFDSFEEKDQSLDAYLKKGVEINSIESEMESWSKQLEFTYQWDVLPEKNWNEEWESNFKSVEVDQFCQVRADFYPAAPGFKHDIVINPKMAFGTGHHETTFMMIKMMSSILFTKNKVLDYGCGTGILSILASKMGALEIDAVDIEKPAYENTIENSQINNVYNVRAILGDLNAVVDTGFDLILANINRNVILESLAPLRQKMKPNSILFISGILKQDEEIITQAIKKNKYTIDGRLEKGSWLCMKLLP